MYEDNFDDPPQMIYLSPDSEETPFWTGRRIAYAIVAIILIIALLGTLLYPLLYQIAYPPPPPPQLPLITA